MGIDRPTARNSNAPAVEFENIAVGSPVSGSAANGAIPTITWVSWVGLEGFASGLALATVAGIQPNPADPCYRWDGSVCC
ncbi:hypothetical protein L1987_25128 [Smallanthus sonchifolius]|uniref:Uncharacterized protein n=1 Tax=Smallanthus sonchifolius TaxID=185202 RepID=A0ACB9INA1_9ASTR|nr:hypothetical protein L1987_25128 [Smallanthus sonchifolius]